ncbi:MAG: hypothetical protein WCI92_12385 [Bacteroidota bacterium]
MKNITLLISLFFVSSFLHAQEYWQKINSPDYVSDVNGIVSDVKGLIIKVFQKNLM